MIVLLWILGQLFAFAGIYFSYKKKDVIKTLFLGEGVFWSLYAICSGLLLWIGYYSIKKTLFATCILLLIYGAVAFIISFKKKNIGNFRDALEIKQYIPLFVLLIAAFFLSGNRSGFHDMSQDSGIYPARALFYMYDQNDTVIQFPEANRLMQDMEKQYYNQVINDIHCFNPGSYYEDEQSTYCYDAPSGVIYGIPTFASLLALWGKILGVGNMLGLVTWLYMLSVALVYIALHNRKVAMVGKTCLTAIYMICPMLIWAGHQSLTEIFQVALVALFLALFLEKDEPVSFLAALPLVAFMYVHITGFFLIPIWVILGFLVYAVTKKKRYLIYLLLLLPGFVTAFLWEGDVATFYIDEHFDLIFRYIKYIISKQNVRYVVLGTGIFCELLATVFLVVALCKKTHPAGKERKNKKGRTASLCAWIAVVVVTFCFGLALYRCLKEVGRLFVEDTVTHLLTCCGFIVLPLAMLGILCMRKAEEHKKEIVVCSLMTAYHFLVFCLVLYTKIDYYYYYGRYMVYIYPVIFLAASLLIHKMKPYVVVPVTVAVIVVTLLMNPALLKYQDMTDLSYENLETICDTIESDYVCDGIAKERCAIIINDSGYEEKGLFTLPLKAITGLDIYFLYDRGLQEYQLSELGLMYDRVYMVTAAYQGFYEEEQTTWEILQEIVNEVHYYDIEDVNIIRMPKSPLVFPNKYLVMRAVQ